MAFVLLFAISTVLVDTLSWTTRISTLMNWRLQI